MKIFFTLYTSRVGLLVFSLVIDIILSRVWGPERKGVYFLVVSLVTQIPILAGLGVEYEMPLLAKQGNLSATVFPLLKWLSWRSALIVFCACYIAFVLFEDKISIHGGLLFVYLILVSCSEVVFNVFFYYLIAAGRVLSTIFIRYTRRILLLLGLIILFLTSNLTVWSALYVYAGCLIFVVLYCLLRFRERHGLSNGKIEAHPSKSSFAIKILELFCLRGVIYIAGFVLSNETVGYLSVAFALLEILLFIPNAAGLYLISRISKGSYSSDRIHVFSVIILLSVIQAFFVYFFSDELILLLYGKAFYPAIGLTKKYALASIPLSLVVVFVADALRNKNRRPILISLSFGSLFMILGGCILIYSLGVNGIFLTHITTAAIVILTNISFGRMPKLITNIKGGQLWR